MVPTTVTRSPVWGPDDLEGREAKRDLLTTRLLLGKVDEFGPCMPSPWGVGGGRAVMIDSDDAQSHLQWLI